MIPIVLASGSPRRRALIEALGIEVEVCVSDVEEVLEGDPGEVVLDNARRKRDDVARHIKDRSLVIAADTVVVLGAHILGKPADLDEARAMLRRLSGKTHEVVTGVAIVDTGSRRTAEGIEITRVTFRDLDPEDLDRFVEAVRPLDRAGAYTVDGPGSLLVARYDGCYQNVLGLPMVRLDMLLRELGDSLFARVHPQRARFL